MKTTLRSGSLFTASLKQFRIALLVSFLSVLSSSFSEAQTVAPASCDNTVYQWGSTADPASINPTTGTYTVPAGGPYLIQIKAAGAAGGYAGSNTGGSGAVLMGTFIVNSGQVLNITAGAPGSSNTYAAGGGGGSGVIINGATTPLIIAGGGGGGDYYGSGGNALATATGSNTGSAGNGGIVAGAGSSGGGGLNSIGSANGSQGGSAGFNGTGGVSGTGGSGGGGVGGGGGGMDLHWSTYSRFLWRWRRWL